jgi:hypothetical protein
MSETININENANNNDNAYINETTNSNNNFADIKNTVKNHSLFIALFIVIILILIACNIYSIYQIEKNIKTDMDTKINDNFTKLINNVNINADKIKSLNDLSNEEFKKNKINFNNINDKLIYNDRNLNIMISKFSDQYLYDLIRNTAINVYKNIELIDLIKGTYKYIKEDKQLIVDIYKADEFFLKFANNEKLMKSNNYTIDNLKTSMNYMPNTDQIIIRIVIINNLSTKKIEEKYILIKKDINGINNILKPVSILKPGDKYTHSILTDDINGAMSVEM